METKNFSQDDFRGMVEFIKNIYLEAGFKEDQANLIADRAADHIRNNTAYDYTRGNQNPPFVVNAEYYRRNAAELIKPKSPHPNDVDFKKLYTSKEAANAIEEVERAL